MSSFQKRVLSALVMLPTVVGALFFSPQLFTLLILVAAAIAAQEWLFLVMSHVRKRGGVSVIVMIVLAVLAVLLPYFTGLAIGIAASSFLGLAIWLMDAQIMQHQCSKEICRSRKWMLLGLLYIALATVSLLWLYGHKPDGLYLTLLVCAMVWATDIFAYFAGKAIGGPKMAPKISPNKTWAGLFGGMAGAAVVAVIFGLPQFRIGLFDGVPLYCMALMGALLAGVGQIGDLLISALKRHYDVKDTGNIIPGHGGILDRIDGLLLVSLVFAVVVMMLESF